MSISYESGNDLVVNVLFIDNEAKTITGYCENYELVVGSPYKTHDKIKKSVCIPIQGLPFELDYVEYYV
jgi:hypothetical protein